MLHNYIEHPGTLLRDDFLGEMAISQYRLAKATHLPESRISKICRGERAISADTALRLAAFFETTPDYWLNLQKNYELARAKADFPGDLNIETAADLCRH